MTEPRYYRVLEMVREVIETCELDSFPLNLEKINQCYLNLFQVRTFADLKKSHYRKWLKMISTQKITSEIGSDDGFTVKDTINDINNLIFINETKPIARQRFTFAHELGHIFMEHLFEAGCSLLLNSDYNEDSEHAVYENEANYFARNLLCPADKLVKTFRECGIQPVIKGCSKIYANPDNPAASPIQIIMERFGLSKQAAQIRLNCLDFDITNYDICFD